MIFVASIYSSYLASQIISKFQPSKEIQMLGFVPFVGSIEKDTNECVSYYDEGNHTKGFIEAAKLCKRLMQLCPPYFVATQINKNQLCNGIDVNILTSNFLATYWDQITKALLEEEKSEDYVLISNFHDEASMNFGYPALGFTGCVGFGNIDKEDKGSAFVAAQRETAEESKLWVEVDDTNISGVSINAELLVEKGIRTIQNPNKWTETIKVADVQYKQESASFFVAIATDQNIGSCNFTCKKKEVVTCVKVKAKLIPLAVQTNK